MNKLKIISAIWLLINISNAIGSPKLSIVIMIDNFSHRALSHIQPYLRGGIAYLVNNGLRYEHACWPHARPCTATGHTGLVSGTIAANHGVIDNKWRDAQGKEVAFEDDSADCAAVFAPHGLYNYGKSAHNIMVDTLADQVILSKKNFNVFSISLKSRAAIAMAGTCGKAIWHDNIGHQFTSSKAYFDALPDWIQDFNTALKQEVMDQKSWSLIFKKDSPAYATVEQKTYEFSRAKQQVEQPITQDNFEMTPAATTALIKLAQECLAQEFPKQSDGNFLLFLSISSTDKVFHQFGPDSLEYLDMLYHLDSDLKSFFNVVYQYAKPEEVIFVLSADHGGMPVIESLQKQGYTKAFRINTEQLKNSINDVIEKKFNAPNLVLAINTPEIYLDHILLENFSKKAQIKMLHIIKKIVQQQPGIKKVWTFNELQKKAACVDEFEQRYKQQLFPGRSGDLIFQVFPYVYASEYEHGAGHKTPYNYDTHVPLIVYQKNMIESQQIIDSVWVPQVAPTLAQLFGIPKPSASTFDLLPGIVY
jgi:predicted AlkP superfamily pyrophosphatase or phosphodiesterase